MKFALISTMDGAPWGGSEELWSQAAVRLTQAGHAVHALVVHWPQLAEKITALTQHGVTLRTYPARNARLRRRLWNSIANNERRCHEWLKRLDPDLVVISQGHNSGGLTWAKTCRDAGIPYVLIVHCNSELWWFSNHEVADTVAGYQGARRVYCVSQGNLNLLRQQLADPLLNAEIIRNPYNVSAGPLLDWPDASAGLRLACVARLDTAAKGHDLLLQVMALPAWRERNIELNIFGTGPNEVPLRRLAAMLQLANVRFHGHVRDIREIWRHNHLLLLPSRYEGLPLALIEAMWCGRAAIVTDVGGNAELCLDNETGFVAGSATVTAFDDAMQRAWNRRGEWLDLGRAARAMVEEVIPRDPVAVFCRLLYSCAEAGDNETVGAELSGV